MPVAERCMQDFTISFIVVTPETTTLKELVCPSH